MRWIWPSGLAGQLIVLVLIALVLAQAVGFILLLSERSSAIEALRREQLARRIVGVVDILQKSPAEFHPQLLQVSSTGLLRFSLSRRPKVDIDDLDDEHHLGWLESHLRKALGGRLVVAVMEDEDEDHGRGKRRRIHDVNVAVQIGERQWLNVRTALPPVSPSVAVPTLVSLGVAAFTMVIMVVITARRLARPLQELATAADGLGRGENVVAPVERGPAEVRHLVRAFNEMRDRLGRFVSDRTRMLAAISHDLRTPITSLRLQAELLEESEGRKKILTTLHEMQRMVEVTLTFARQDAASEETRMIDLGALVESICDDLSDVGMPVQILSDVRPKLACRPVALKRALRNLIENAATHGTRARVEVKDEKTALLVVIDDEGPGIPEAAFENVFQPFVRLEESRSRDTGGAGLGMAIARSIVRGHGGDVELENRKEGGLRATVRLPRGRS